MNFTNKVHEALAIPLEEKFLHYASIKPLT